MTARREDHEFVREVFEAINDIATNHAERLAALAHFGAQGILTPEQAARLHCVFEASLDDVAGPDHTPWSTPRMRLALALRDLAEVFVILRGHGWSQRRIGGAIGSTQSEISEILTRRRNGQAYHLFERVALGFGLPRGWLGLGYDPATARLLHAGFTRVTGGGSSVAEQDKCQSRRTSRQWPYNASR